MEWVELSHPDTGATHKFPANGGAIDAARERGWVEADAEAEVGEWAGESDEHLAVDDGYSEED